jgi:hypothetical protein
MPGRDFSKTEIIEVVARYPKLQLKSAGVLEGILDMHAEYDGSLLADSFTVQVTSSNPNSERIPALREIGGRTEAIARKYKIDDLRDLHRNLDGTACVCVRQMEGRKFPPGSSLLLFIEELAVPYLYGLSYYDKHGKWPWADYSHGTLGLLEFYAEDDAQKSEADIRDVIAQVKREHNWKEYHKQFRKPSADKLCVCGSRRPFHKCHSRAWRGVLRLHADLHRLNLNLDRLRQVT